MNTNKIYFADIYMITNIVHTNNNENDVISSFVKKTIVKPIKNNRYIDLLSKEKYYAYGYLSKKVNGTVYLRGPLVPFNSIVYVEKQNMSKKKVLRKFNEYENK